MRKSDKTVKVPIGNVDYKTEVKLLVKAQKWTTGKTWSHSISERKFAMCVIYFTGQVNTLHSLKRLQMLKAGQNRAGTWGRFPTLFAIQKIRADGTQRNQSDRATKTIFSYFYFTLRWPLYGWTAFQIVRASLLGPRPFFYPLPLPLHSWVALSG